ncbi:MAG: EamA family transporter [Candidatus Omnitrophica bacterium]|nr:EamA family transporter [Candidatus Omnitrophota bacterium]MCM8793074.1 EamA family transporter [Candidatus Omnitrophota bacterium]
MGSFYLILVSVGLGVLGQIFLKQGMLGFGGNFFKLFPHIIQSPFVLLGFLFYFLSSLIWLIVLSRVELSYAYPMISLGYVFIVFLSWIIFKENVSFLRWLGVILISLGVILIGK